MRVNRNLHWLLAAGFCAIVLVAQAGDTTNVPAALDGAGEAVSGIYAEDEFMAGMALYRRPDQESMTNGLNLIKKAAQQGDKRAQFILGTVFLVGDSQFRNPNEAFKYLAKSAEDNNPQAQYLLGIIYYSGMGVPVDYTNAVYWFTKSSNNGDPYGAFSLGCCYSNGRGTHIDYQAAAEQFRRSADGGLRDGMTYYGEACYFGHGTKQDEIAAFKWFRLAAEKGEVRAMVHLATKLYASSIDTNDRVQAFGLVQSAAVRNYCNAQILLSLYYEAGFGVDKSMTEAMKWLIVGADNGYVDAKAERNYLLNKALVSSNEMANALSEAKEFESTNTCPRFAVQPPDVFDLRSLLKKK